EVIGEVTAPRPPEAEGPGQQLPAQAADALDEQVQGQRQQPGAAAEVGEGPGQLAPVHAPGEHGQQDEAAEQAPRLTHGTSRLRKRGSDPVCTKWACCSSAMSTRRQ